MHPPPFSGRPMSGVHISAQWVVLLVFTLGELATILA